MSKLFSELSKTHIMSSTRVYPRVALKFAEGGQGSHETGSGMTGQAQGAHGRTLASLGSFSQGPYLGLGCSQCRRHAPLRRVESIGRSNTARD